MVALLAESHMSFHTFPENGIITAVGKTLKFTGDSATNDSFSISNNTDGVGDNRNLLQMLALQEADVNGISSGSFQDIFNNTVAEIGTTVRSAEMSKISAESSRDEAQAREDEVAGVSMDEEASALMQFQQAYQANARILQTARDLFEFSSRSSIINSSCHFIRHNRLHLYQLRQLFLHLTFFWQH